MGNFCDKEADALHVCFDGRIAAVFAREWQCSNINAMIIVLDSAEKFLGSLTVPRCLTGLLLLIKRCFRVRCDSEKIIRL